MLQYWRALSYKQYSWNRAICARISCCTIWAHQLTETFRPFPFTLITCMIWLPPHRAYTDTVRGLTITLHWMYPYKRQIEFLLYSLPFTIYQLGLKLCTRQRFKLHGRDGTLFNGWTRKQKYNSIWLPATSITITNSHRCLLCDLMTLQFYCLLLHLPEQCLIQSIAWTMTYIWLIRDDNKRIKQYSLLYSDSD